MIRNSPNMDTPIEEVKRNDFMEVVKQNDVAIVKDYFKERNFTLNEFYALVKANRKELTKFIKNRDSSRDIKYFFMKFIGEKRKIVIDIAKAYNF